MGPVSARRRIAGKTTKGCAADFINLIADLPAGQRTVVVCRVSTSQQAGNDNLREQRSNTISEVEKRRGIVVDVVTPPNGHASGYDPWWLVMAVNRAKRYQAAIVAETTDRLVRNGLYRSNHPFFKTLQATTDELEELSWVIGGVPLYTVLHPDAPPRKVHSYQAERGQGHYRKGGRPTRHPKKTRREVLKPRVLELHFAGMPKREIARTVNVPESTVRLWLK